MAIGHDGWQLLAAIDHPEAPPWLREVSAIATLRRVWMQNYWWDGTQLRWREAGNIPPAAQFISSPYDVDAHYARKYTTQWVGYKVHLTETCEDDAPHLITHVEAMSGPTADGAATPKRVFKNFVTREELGVKWGNGTPKTILNRPHGP
jgi:transposase